MKRPRAGLRGLLVYRGFGRVKVGRLKMPIVKASARPNRVGEAPRCGNSRIITDKAHGVRFCIAVQNCSLHEEVCPLAEMIGPTRSRVSCLMNRFRKMGFVDYNGSLQVNR